jgi:ABC-type molybdate transport system ATPase subunit
MGDNHEDALIEAAKDVYLKTGKPGFILTSIYDILLNRGEIQTIEEQSEDLVYHVESRMKFEAARKGTKALKELAHEKGSPVYNHLLTVEIKKQIVANYFTLQNQIDSF